MTRYQLYKELRRHLNLSERRNIAFEQNKAAKYFLWVGVAFTILYLMFLAVPLSLAANESRWICASELMYGISPLILTVDFFFRFIAQQTPTQLVKPYTLLPISKFACIDCFLVRSMLSSGNLIWFALFIPYALMSVVFSEGLCATLGFLLGFYLLIVLNSQWYTLARSLINTHIAWWLLPLGVYALIYSPWYVGAGAGFDRLCETYAHLGRWLPGWNVLAFLALLCLIAVVFFVNRRLQYHLIWAELGKTETTQLRHASKFAFFNRFGECGEYMKLEARSIMRNKNLRKTFIFANVFVLIISLIVSFTDIYSGEYMTVFWCVYNFAIYGAMVLVKVMCYEGNYIECLMVRKENIISLLRAKYYFYSAMLLIPLLLMIPTLLTGKCTPLMLVSVMLFSAGLIHFLFLLMAIYNKQTMPLNSKFIGKGSMENNYLQIVVEMCVFIVPIILIKVLEALWGATVSYCVILAIGLGFILTHPVWIRYIYNRMQRRRYENLEGFRATRL